MINEIFRVFKILHDSFIERIEIKNSMLKFSLGAEFLANKLNIEYSYFFLVFMNVSEIEFEDWSETNQKYEDIDSILKFASELWFTHGDYKHGGKIYLHGHGGNSPDVTSCGGTISFKCDNYKIFKQDGNILSMVELEKAYKLYSQEIE